MIVDKSIKPWTFFELRAEFYPASVIQNSTRYLLTTELSSFYWRIDYPGIQLAKISF